MTDYNNIIKWQMYFNKKNIISDYYTLKIKYCKLFKQLHHHPVYQKINTF